MLWINLFLMLLLVAGHTEVLVAIINRLHAMPIPCRTLRQIRHLHDLLIPAFPVALVWCVGLNGPGLLTGGSWQQLPIGWAIYCSICALGAIALTRSTIRWISRTPPGAQLSNHTETVDVAERIGYRPLGQGPYRWMTDVPRNGIFKIEVSDKIYRLPNLPQAWDGLSILHLSDLHFTGTIDLPFFEQVTELSAELDADMIVFTGDLIDRQHLLEWLPQTLGRLKAPLGCYFILGNHDWFADPEVVRERMAEIGWCNVGGRTETIEHAGHQLVIAGTETPWIGAHPDFSGTPDDAFRLLLSHTPDHLAWARQQQVDLMLSGHNHGGQVVLPLFGPVYSPSRLGVRYAGGPFWEDPTLLYVSRGISGLHPLRWNCPPELTKLVLRAQDAGE